MKYKIEDKAGQIEGMRKANLDRGVNSCNHVEIKVISLGESRAISGSLRIFLRRIVKLQKYSRKKENDEND